MMFKYGCGLEMSTAITNVHYQASFDKSDTAEDEKVVRPPQQYSVFLERY